MITKKNKKTCMYVQDAPEHNMKSVCQTSGGETRRGNLRDKYLKSWAIETKTISMDGCREKLSQLPGPLTWTQPKVHSVWIPGLVHWWLQWYGQREQLPSDDPSGLPGPGLFLHALLLLAPGHRCLLPLTEGKHTHTADKIQPGTVVHSRGWFRVCGLPTGPVS